MVLVRGYRNATELCLHVLIKDMGDIGLKTDSVISISPCLSGNREITNGQAMNEVQTRQEGGECKLHYF